MPATNTVMPAQVEDGDAIFELLTEAFRVSYLKFSVYQSPRARSFLAEQIRDGAARNQPPFFVIRHEGRLVGFYNAEQLGEEFFLKYIATDLRCVRTGVGNALLGHFEATAADTGCRRSGLGVFENNPVAAQWYARRGYRVEGCELFLRYALADLDQPGAGVLEWDAGVLEQAIAAEREQGFSAVTASLGGVPVRLGLIAGEVVNVIEPGDAAPPRLAAAVAARFRAERCWLLMRAQEEAARPATQPETLERSLHMVRELS